MTYWCEQPWRAVQHVVHYRCILSDKWPVCKQGMDGGPVQLNSDMLKAQTGMKVWTTEVEEMLMPLTSSSSCYVERESERSFKERESRESKAHETHAVACRMATHWHKCDLNHLNTWAASRTQKTEMTHSHMSDFRRNVPSPFLSPTSPSMCACVCSFMLPLPPTVFYFHRPAILFIRVKIWETSNGTSHRQLSGIQPHDMVV